MQSEGDWWVFFSILPCLILMLLHLFKLCFLPFALPCNFFLVAGHDVLGNRNGCDCLLLTASSKMWEKKWLKKRTVNQKGIRTENFRESQPVYAAKNKKVYLEENTRSVAEQPFGKTARMGANHRLTQTFQQENNPFELKGKEAETNKERWLDRARTLLGCKNAIFLKTREERFQKWFSNYKGCLLSFKSQGLWLGFSRPDDPSPNSLGKMSAHHNHGTWLPALHFKRWSHLKLWACLQFRGLQQGQCPANLWRIWSSPWYGFQPRRAADT